MNLYVKNIHPQKIDMDKNDVGIYERPECVDVLIDDDLTGE